ncbi:MAG TPA: hypothetical protein VN618_03380 [Solirubrobacteraceae bacterium]|nr:hypothetical protein [Solirubrobacteraceae bacterium]
MSAAAASRLGAADRLSRRVGPRLLAASAGFSLPAKLRARATRARGGRGLVELFIAFDDPCSAVAVHELAEPLGRRAVELRIVPVIRRGLAGDPAVARKRDYALLDAGRLARRRLGRELARREVLPPEEVAFLAEWTAAAPPGPAVTDFCRAALARLWFEDGGPVSREDFAALWRERVGGEPSGDAAAVRRCEARMARRGPYETPAVWTGGRWYFAHDRPRQICAWLDELGWAAA